MGPGRTQKPHISHRAGGSKAMQRDAVCLWQVSLHPSWTPYTSHSRAGEAALTPGEYHIAS